MADEWKDRAACLGQDLILFFPGPGGGTETAKRICRGCPVRPQCYASSDAEEFGVWAGFTSRERNALKRNAKRKTALRARGG